MGLLRLLVLLFLVSMKSCEHPGDVHMMAECMAMHTEVPGYPDRVDKAGRGALLLTRFKSLNELKEVVTITYADDKSVSRQQHGTEVRITHCTGDRAVVSILKTGISQLDLSQARDGGFWDKLRVCLSSPYALVSSSDLLRVHFLSRRRPVLFDEGDVAFYDIAETMVYDKMREEDIMFMSSADLSEKGYINTFNHITAQAFMTTLFSEKLADYIADLHERYNMPELITGEFTEAQLKNLENGPVDNYVDIINNEWGQELGKALKKKYNITRRTFWTPELMANYLNDIQGYNSWSFQIGFKPFRPSDVIVQRFARKVNMLSRDLHQIRRRTEWLSI